MSQNLYSTPAPEFKTCTIDFDVFDGLFSLYGKTITKDFERVNMIPVKQVEEFIKWRMVLKSSYRNGGRVLLIKLILLSISAKLDKSQVFDIEVKSVLYNQKYQCKLKDFYIAQIKEKNNFSYSNLWRFETLSKQFGNFNPFTISMEVTIKNLKNTPIGDSFAGCISNDLSNMFQNELFSDVTILVDGGEFKAHRVILAARSPYLSAMLQHKMVEGISRIIVLEDIDRWVFEDVLYYIYTGRLRNLKEYAQELLVASAKFCLDNLKDICCEHLGRSLTIESVCDILILSDIYDCKALKELSKNFITTNSPAIIHTDPWKNLLKDQPYLMAEICEKLVVKNFSSKY